MRIYTLWHEGDDGDFPWIVDAVDQYTIDNNGECPPPYLARRADIQVREMVIDVPEEAVRKLFSPPHVRATIIKEDQKVGQPVGHKGIDPPDALLLAARNFGSGYARAGEVAAAAYRLAAAKLRAWGDESHAQDLESAASQAERDLASEGLENTP